MKIIGVIPAYNDEATIGSIVLKTKKHVDGVIVVDDGSKDKTAEVAELAGADVVKHKRNRGKGAAIRDGINKAKELDPDVVVCLDADAQHEPEEIPVLIEGVSDEGADIVIGSRFLKHSVRNLPLYRRFGQKILDFSTNLIGKSKISDTQSGFRAFSRNAIEKLKFKQHGLDIESGVLIEAKDYNLKIKEVPINVRYDVENSSKKHPLSHGVHIIISIIKIISETHALLFFGMIGLMLLVAGLLLGYEVVRIYDDARVLALGTALITLILVISGVFLMSTGIILYAIQDMIRRRDEE